MSSLRNRIAVSCTILLIGTVSVISLLEAFAFRHALFDVRERLSRRIVSEIRTAIEAQGVLPGLDRWGSTTIFVQVDERRPDGRIAVLARSSELGPSVLSPGAVSLQGRPLYSIDQPVTYKNRHFVIRIATDLSYVNAVLAFTQVFVVAVTLFAIPLTVFVSIVLSKNAIRPIEELIATMRNVDSEQLDRRVGFEERTDEIGELARTFDDMLVRLRESFERERRFIADASHELKTPLTVIHSNAQMLSRWAQSDETIRAESIQAIITESKSLGVLIEELLMLARIDSGDPVAHEAVDVARLCTELVQAYRPQVEARPLALLLKTHADAASLTVDGNAVLLRRVVGNLLDNALKFTRDGTITLTLQRRDAAVEIAVADTGIGIPEAELERIFERLYRTDGSRTRQDEGFGLGLSIARAFVHAHHGTIVARSREGAGTCVTVWLPLPASQGA